MFEELLELWKKVRAMDVLQPIKRREFTMRAVLMWTIHDFPAYGIISSCEHQGYRTCPPCGTDIVNW
jgi:hypothetical protein